MKKSLLTSLAVATGFAAMAAPALSPAWTKTMPASYEAGSAVYNAPVAVNLKGNAALTGAFTEDMTIGGSALSAVGTSAYLAFADAAGEIKWAVALSGAVSVSDVVIAEDDCIYVAGTYTDEVELGAATGEGKTITGMEIWGDPTVELNASFIAKYTGEGALAGVQTYIPEALPELDGTDYFMFDGDVFFHINHLALDGNKLYASAIYSGTTTVGESTMAGSYNDPWWGMFFVDLRAAGVFALDLDLKNAAPVASLDFAESLATEDGQYQATSVTLAAQNGTVYMAATCNGPMVLSTAGGDKETLEITAPSYAYVFAEVTGGKLGKYGIAECPASGQQERFILSDIAVSDADIAILGYETFANNYGQDDEYIGYELFAYCGSAADLTALTKSTFEAKQGELENYGLTQCATLADGSIVFGTLAYDAKGDLAGAGQTYTFADGVFAPFATVADANGAAAAGGFVLFSTIGETAATFALYKDENSGVADITVEAGEGTAEYFNLQGMKVENPANGIYIRRQGKSVEKVLVK
ncbi:MAG: hypothetical protein HDS65_03340 [Bacteroidales bacterium]|nr:hypothetical protein [Bacteroidales bacterium]